MRTASAVWRASPELVLALDERFGDPVDSYVNGSQVWLLDNGPGGITLEWRLHPVAAYRAPAELSHYELWERAVAQLQAGGDPGALALGEERRALPSIWEGLEAFAAVRRRGRAGHAGAGRDRRPRSPARRRRPRRPRAHRRRVGAGAWRRVHRQSPARRAPRIEHCMPSSRSWTATRWPGRSTSGRTSTGEFMLRSGATSNEYFDKYLVRVGPGAAARRSARRWCRWCPTGTEALAGLELGGVPLATMLSQLTGLPALFVRKEAKTLRHVPARRGR